MSNLQAEPGWIRTFRMAREAISKSGSTSPALSRIATCGRSSPWTVGVLGFVRPEPVEGPGIRAL